MNILVTKALWKSYQIVLCYKSNPDSVGEDFHLSPQEISIRPIVNEPVQINLKYKEEKDKKLDLYYLLDVSKTMEENKVILCDLLSLNNAILHQISNFYIFKYYVLTTFYRE